MAGAVGEWAREDFSRGMGEGGRKGLERISNRLEEKDCGKDQFAHCDPSVTGFVSFRIFL